jgi:NAD-dependent dihydropyrimidine dehydrogenase PreA subunit
MLLKNSPKVFGQALYQLMFLSEEIEMAKIIIERSECSHLSSGCVKCIEECPMQLIEEDWLTQEGRFVKEDDQCIECRNCEVTCPEKVIKIQDGDFS